MRGFALPGIILLGLLAFVGWKVSDTFEKMGGSMFFALLVISAWIYFSVNQRG